MADVLSILSIQVGNFVGKLRSLEYEKTGNLASLHSTTDPAKALSHFVPHALSEATV